MRGFEARRLLILDPARRRYHLRLVHPMASDAGDLLLSGEVLCHRLLGEDASALVLARGPMPFLSGNKITVGYISPLTGLPHYSFVGGRGFAQLLNLGLDAIVLTGQGRPSNYVVISGRAPRLTVEWKSADDLPPGQRGAFYWLLERELDGQPEQGSILTLGEGTRANYRTANLAADGLYHAGRGGAGAHFARFAAAMVLRGDPVSWQDHLGPRAERFWELREGEIHRRLAEHTQRLSKRDGGTVTKLHATGRGDLPTLPARNAQQLGYDLADLGAREVLRASRAGQTGCQWCQVNCRHWHWIEADYAPDGRDRLLDDFEPTYAIFAMLDLAPDDDSLQAKLRLLKEVDRRVILPVEQMGCDVIDVGVGLAALFEGLERGLVPLSDVPPSLQSGPYLGSLEAAASAVAAMRAATPSPALKAVGDGPQTLVERYPVLREIVFTSGPRTLGNPGHANALWTFLMPFSRFFSHYSGQIYKIEGKIDPEAKPAERQALFRRVIAQMLKREFFGVLGNALSTCAFTFVIFSQDGRGVTLDESDLLIRTLACYGIETSREELEWFAEAFWTQSIAFKLANGWQPPTAADFPIRVFEALSQALNCAQGKLRTWMGELIAEWKHQAAEMMVKHGQDDTELNVTQRSNS